MSIFTCFIDDITDTINQVRQQANVVDDVQNMISVGMQPIVGGAWTGEGASSFVDEVQSRILPEIAQLAASISGFGGGVSSAIEIVGGYSDQALSAVNTLCDTYDAII